MIKLFSFLALTSFVCGQINFPGRCNTNVAVVKSFNVSAYSGTWYEIHRYSHFNEMGLECVTANYKISNATLVIVNNTGIANNTFYQREGKAVPRDTSGEAKLNVSFDEFTNVSPYWVLKTNYESFSLVYSCRDLDNNMRAVSSWILSRKPAISAVDTIEVNQYFADNPDLKSVLDWRFYNHTIQWGETCIIGGSTAIKSTGILMVICVFITLFT